MCWWCNKGRQSREHLFKECTAWAGGAGGLWRKIGETSGRKEMSEDSGHTFKSRKGFGLGVRQARARPSNTAVRDLLSQAIGTQRPSWPP